MLQRLATGRFALSWTAIQKRFNRRLTGGAPWAAWGLTALAMALAIGLSACGERQVPIGSAPVLQMKTYAGENLTVDGKDAAATLLVFWATWCGPCIMEIPNLMALHAKHKDKNFRVIAINVDDPEGGKALPIIKRFGINYPVLIGSEDDMKRYGGVNALPTAFLIDREGILRDKIQGVLPEEELERRILKLL